MITYIHMHVVKLRRKILHHLIHHLDYTPSALGSPQLTTRVRLVQWVYTYTYISIYTSSRLYTIYPCVSTANDSCEISSVGIYIYIFMYTYIYTSSRLCTICSWVSTADDTGKFCSMSIYMYIYIFIYTYIYTYTHHLPLGLHC